MGSHSVVPMSLNTLCDKYPLLKLVYTDTYVIGI